MISYIIATYNVGETLRDCLQSFYDQKDKNFELILIDGGSDDDTISIIKEFEPIISYWKSENDKGIYDAWNKGLNHIHGEWVSFIGGDDRLLDEHSIERLNTYVADKDFDFIYGYCSIHSRKDKFVKYHGEPWEAIRSDFFKGVMKLLYSGMLLNVRVFKSVGRFNDRYKIAGDFDLLLRTLLLNESIYFTKKHSEIVVREGGISYKMRMGVMREVQSILKDNGLDPSTPTMRFYIFKTKIITWLTALLGEDVVSVIRKII